MVYCYNTDLCKYVQNYSLVSCGDDGVVDDYDDDDDDDDGVDDDGVDDDGVDDDGGQIIVGTFFFLPCPPTKRRHQLIKRRGGRHLMIL